MQTRLFFSAVLLAFSLGATAAPLSRSMPAGAMVYGEMTGLGDKFVQLRDSKTLKALLASPQYKSFTKSPNFVKAMASKGFVEGYLAMDLWKAANLLLNDAAIALYPTENGESAALALMRMKDAAAWAKVRERLDPIITLAGEDVTREKKGDIEILNFQNQFYIALTPTGAAAASTEGLLQQGLAGLKGPLKAVVANDPAFVQMQRDMGAKHLAQVFIHMKKFGAWYGLPMAEQDKLDNGVASLLLHGVMNLAVRSPYTGITLDADEKGFALNAGIAGDLAESRKKYTWFFSDPKTPGTHDVPAVPGLMGGFAIHRNIGQWYTARESLLEERLMAGFDEFESGLGNLFPGRDVGDDIMPAFGSTFTLLAAEQTFDHFEGEPGIKLPGFALILDLDKPENGKLFQLVFQTIVTITNIVGVEEGLDREPSVMTAIVHQGVPINTIEYIQLPKGQRLNIGYNFQPCAATINGRFVFCTSLALCKALVTELRKPQDTKRVNRNFNFELHPRALAALVKDNRRTLVAKRIQQGKTAAEANTEIKAVESLLDYIQLLRLDTSVKEKGFQLKLEGQWK